jgi:mannose-6-phosphate isomerase-like protein (cupin superfamily)
VVRHARADRAPLDRARARPGAQRHGAAPGGAARPLRPGREIAISITDFTALQDVDLSRLRRNVADVGFTPLQNVGLKGQPDEGLICNLISRDLSGSIDLNVSWSKMLPGQHHLCHHHPDASEFIVILKGNPLMHLGHKQFRGTPGDGIYIPYDVIHGVTNDTDEVCEMIVGLSKPADWEFVFDE